MRISRRGGPQGNAILANLLRTDPATPLTAPPSPGGAFFFARSLENWPEARHAIELSFLKILSNSFDACSHLVLKRSAGSAPPLSVPLSRDGRPFGGCAV